MENVDNPTVHGPTRKNGLLFRWQNLSLSHVTTIYGLQSHICGASKFIFCNVLRTAHPKKQKQKQKKKL